MATPIKHNIHTLCTWSGAAFALVFMIAWWPIANYFPPHNPKWTATQVAALYQDNTNAIRLGMMLAMFSSIFLMSWAAAIAMYIRRMEGTRPILSYIQIMTGAGTTLFFALPAMIWTWAAFRPDRPTEITLAIHDFGWLMIVMAVPAAIMQNLSFGIAILTDKNPQPLFPRWSGYLNLWVALLFLPSGLITFFKTGPFAWSGVIGFWLPAIGFFSWIMVMTPLMLLAGNTKNSSEDA